jgi:hypothetical protein
MHISPACLLTIWTQRAAFAASKFPCLTIDGNADSHGTSAVFQTVTLFYAVCAIFPSISFYSIKLYVLMWFFLSKMVSLCDTHWGNFNKFAKFVKMARVQRVNLRLTRYLFSRTPRLYHLLPVLWGKTLPSLLAVAMVLEVSLLSWLKWIPFPQPRQLKRPSTK